MIPIFILITLVTYITHALSLIWNLLMFYLDIIRGKCDWQSVHYKTVFQAVFSTHKMILLCYKQLIQFEETVSLLDNLPVGGEGHDVDRQT